VSTDPSARPGLQRERTILAWDRTGLAFMVVSALLIRVGGAPYDSPRHLPALLGILLGAWLVAGVTRGGLERPQVRARPRLVRAVGVAAVALVVASIAVVLGVVRG
jgi:uncharacterized membrane protein YidH (DUF202 family)